MTALNYHMFSLIKPTTNEINLFLATVALDALSYSEVGRTFDKSPTIFDLGYNVDHNRQLLGSGEESSDRAKDAIRGWEMFAMPWVKLISDETPIEVGKKVAILISHFGFYSLNAARIVYVIDEPTRFGFAYGTLEHHGEIGEERFSVEYNVDTGEVWYDILAFSRPGHFMAKIGYPLTRYLQRSFAADSKKAMAAACAKS